MAFGDRPSNRYSKAWITQRIANRLPPWSHARKSPTSVFQQLINPIGEEIQKTIRSLMEERFNMFLSTCNIELLDHLYKAELPYSFEFSTEETKDGITRYLAPTVYATINGTKTQIAIAEENSIETLYYYCLPTRLEDLEESMSWHSVISPVSVSQLGNISPSTIPLEGHLFVTLSGNTTWETHFKNSIYYSKVKLIGKSKKGTYIEEIVPLRYNGTFKTKNQWKSLSEVFVSHVDATSIISISCLNTDSSIVDSGNISINSDGIERLQFLELSTNSFGSILVGKYYSAPDLDLVRVGFETKEIDWGIELLDNSGTNINANAFYLKPYSDFIYVIDDDNFYVYDRSIPYPDTSLLVDESADTRIMLFEEDNKWIATRGETRTVKTRILDVTKIPTSIRWLITTPDGDTFRVGLDGSLWSTEEEGWIRNERWEEGKWEEQSIDFTLNEAGTYTISVDFIYKNELGDIEERNSKMILYVAAIRPEVQFSLPSRFKKSSGISFDSDGNLWFIKGNLIYKGILYKDYFIVDYERKTVWMNEQYTDIVVEK